MLMGVISAVSFLTGIAFYMKGAWPVLGFFGLDIAADLRRLPAELPRRAAL